VLLIGLIADVAVGQVGEGRWELVVDDWGLELAVAGAGVGFL
jgi:hypothetical protein